MAQATKHSQKERQYGQENSLLKKDESSCNFLSGFIFVGLSKKESSVSFDMASSLKISFAFLTPIAIEILCIIKKVFHFLPNF